MRRMSGMDAAFLYGETPSWHMHVSAVLYADPSGLPKATRPVLRELARAVGRG